MATTPALNITHLEANQGSPEITENESKDILSTAVADYLVINFASDADYTFATGAGVQEWHHGQIQFTDTGVVLTAGRNIIVPDEPKLYIIDNQTAQTLTIKTSAGTQTVDVLTTEGTYVRCDGSEVYLITAGGSGGSTITSPGAMAMDPATLTDADITLSNNDLTVTHNSGSARDGVFGLRPVGGVPVYFEVSLDDVTGGANSIDVLLAPNTTDLQDSTSVSGWRGLLFGHNEATYRGDDDIEHFLGSEGRTNPTAGVNDIFNVAVDPQTGKVWIGVNDTYLDSGNPSTGANPYVTIPELVGGSWYPALNLRNVTAATFAFASDDWTYSAPTGFNEMPVEYLHRTASGVEDDVHPQYYNMVRGDERYLQNQAPQRLETDAEHGSNTSVYEPEGVHTRHTSSGTNGGVASQLPLGPGKVYAEFEVVDATSTWMLFGLVPPTWTRTNRIGDNAGDGVGYRINGSTSNEGVDTTGLTTAGVNDIVSIAIDVSTGEFWFAINDAWESGDPALGTSPSETDTNVDETWFFGITQFQTNECRALFRACDLTYDIPDGFTVLPNSTLHNTLTSRDAADAHPQYALTAGALLDDATLNALASTLKTSASIPDVFVYDTRRDSDGGAWRKRTAHTSWYNETLDTASRGATAEFPEVALIVADDNDDTLTVYDATDSSIPMWMIFDWTTSNNALGVSASATSAITAAEGFIYRGSPAEGLYWADFILDNARKINATDLYVTTQRLADRTGVAAHTVLDPAVELVSVAVRDVAAYATASTPIDPARGVPRPTVAVATDGGVSVVQPDVTVIDLTDTNGDFIDISRDDPPRMAMGYDTGTNAEVHVWSDLDAVAAGSVSATRDAHYSSTGTPDLDLLDTGMNRIAYCGRTRLAMAQDAGLTQVLEHASSPSAGMLALTTKDYATGWTIDDVRGAWLANSKTVDRSTYGNALTETGTVTEAAVATGAELNGYSGFSGSNYLSQAHDTDFDFGTGDFSIVYWYNNSSVPAQQYVFDRNGPSGGRMLSYIDPSTGVVFYTEVGAATSIVSSGAVAQADSRWHMAVLTRAGGTHEVWIDNTLHASSSLTIRDVSSTDAIVRIGASAASGALPAAQTTVSLMRISPTVPSPSQIARMYADEAPLFKDDADCLLDGTADQVDAVAYDHDQGRLYAGTSWGWSEFEGLSRAASAATAVGAPVAVSAAHGKVLRAGASSVTAEVPAQNLREEDDRNRARTDNDPSKFQRFRFTFGGGDTDAALPAGFRSWAVYHSGTLDLEGGSDDYTVTYDGLAETIVYNAAPGAGEVVVFARREIS